MNVVSSQFKNLKRQHYVKELHARKIFTVKGKYIYECTDQELKKALALAKVREQ